jgi:hypothetical protein
MAVTTYDMSITENTIINGNPGRTSFGFKVVAPVDAGGITALTGALSTNLGLAIAGVILGEPYKQSAKLFEQIVSTVRPTNTLAQRENKWLVTGSDGTKLYTLSIGTADLSLLVDGSEEMIAGAARTALVSALQAMWVGDNEGAITIQSIRFVGRNT